VDENGKYYAKELPRLRSLIDTMSALDDQKAKQMDVRAARQFVQRIYAEVILTRHNFVPKEENDDQLFK